MKFPTFSISIKIKKSEILKIGKHKSREVGITFEY